ncbi:MAG: pilus assembly protein [Actinomycetota bacterium]|nr:pilus assembly protein [Actinomycetota bacterium]
MKRLRRRLAGRDDRGSVVEVVVIFPLFWLLLLLVVQGVLWYMADQGAVAGATAGAQALAQGLPNWKTTALVATNSELRSPSVAISSSAPPGLTGVTVTGVAAQVVPWSIHVTVTQYFPTLPTAGAGQ